MEVAIVATTEAVVAAAVVVVIVVETDVVFVMPVTCVAVLAAGPGKTITFTPPGDTQVVKEGEDLRVRCSADCSPTCSYTWVLGSDRIPTTGGVLELRAVDRQQKGMYSCLADNGLGSQGTKLLTVDVQCMCLHLGISYFYV